MSSPTHSATSTTPVRSCGTRDPAGYWLLRDSGSRYRDGGEEQVLRIIEQATDISSTSEELIAHAVDWPQRYHLEPVRANIVRSLELPADARVLEIGAGCGAVTRYLGERCAVVDAVEPVPVRAAAASARTRDLDSVRVFVGEVEDLPAEPAYDVVIVIGVLEYVGSGSADRAPYLEFLAQLATRLVDGGTLVLAIENQLGVKYVAGAPEDHTNRAFDSLEGYPRGGPARTFSRVELESLFAASGLTARTLVAFPDYKLTRAVFGEVPERARSLLYRVPRLPSPDWRARRPKITSERELWRTLVEARLEHEFGNSFLVLGTKGPGPSPLWPGHRSAAFYSNARRARMAMQTLVESEGDEVVLRRMPVAGGAAVGVTASDTTYQDGTDFVEEFAQRGVDGIGPLIRQWLDLLDAAVADGQPGLIDYVPHNFVVADDGELRPIDIELTGFPVEREQVLRRGILWLAYLGAPLAPPERWRPHETVGSLMVALAPLVGLPADDSWFAQTVREEALVQAAVRTAPTGLGEAEWHAKLEGELRWVIARKLRDFPLGDRVQDELVRARKQVRDGQAEVQRLRRQLSTQAAKLDRTERSLAALRRSRAVRVAGRLRHVADRLLPADTRRRAAARRLVRR